MDKDKATEFVGERVFRIIIEQERAREREVEMENESEREIWLWWERKCCLRHLDAVDEFWIQYDQMLRLK